MRRVHGGSAGFTLIEILIALVILMVGLIGILAVFPAAIQSANKTVEDTYAASIAQSVGDAIRMGLEDTPIRNASGETIGFILYHDGERWNGSTWLDGERPLDADRRSGFLRDALDPAKAGQLQAKPYAVFLPLPGERTGFVYPRESLPQDNASRKAKRTVRATRFDKGRARQVDVVEVKTVYRLGRTFGTAPGAGEEEGRDPYPQYSFSFTIEPATGPDPANPSVKQVIPGLYLIVIKVYRNFDPNPDAKRNEPVREFVTNLAV